MENYDFFDKFILFAFLVSLLGVMFEAVVAFNMTNKVFSDKKISENVLFRLQLKFFGSFGFAAVMAIGFGVSGILSWLEIVVAIFAGRWLTYVIILYRIKCKSWWFMAIYAAPAIFAALAVGMQSLIVFIFAVISGGFLHWAKQFLFKNVTMRYLKLLQREFVTEKK